MEERPNQVQIKRERYFEKYDDLPRFISYYHQISLIQELRPEKILEIGVGNKTVSNYLKNFGQKIETCDFDTSLNPDHVADIRRLPMSDDAYDLVTAFEVLEHIPWEDFEKALNELYRVTKKNVIISVPYASTAFEVVIRFPFIHTILRRQYLDLFIRIPFFFQRHVFYGQHYWEMGKRGYPIHKIRQALTKKFLIRKEVRPVMNHFHYFFVLEKRPSVKV